MVADTKGNLHDKSFLSDLAEQFGQSELHRSSGLRNADNDLRVSTAGTEIHNLSQVLVIP